MRLPTTVYSKVAALALLGVVVLVISACAHRFAQPMSITNDMEDPIVIHFLDTSPSIYRDEPLLVRFREVVEDVTTPFHDAYLLPSGSMMEIKLDEYTIRKSYPLVVSNSDGIELFHRDLLVEELDDHDWKVVITPEGIQ
jgi:hypothetical protein